LNANAERNHLTIWRFSDGRAGHDSQSNGLINALNKQLLCRSYDISVPFSFSRLAGCLFKKLPHLTQLPDPDFLIGAGHATHIPMLSCRRVRGGDAIVLMKPSLPRQLFDLCFIPEHDQIRNDKNIVTTAGPLNGYQASEHLSMQHGLILIGGISKHFNWDETQLFDQIQLLFTTNNMNWTITDSPRTPQSTVRRLKSLDKDKVTYLPFSRNPDSSLPRLLQRSGTIWVSEDSMTMIYEALSTGAAVGVLRVPTKHKGKLAQVAPLLSEKQMLTLFADWRKGKKLSPPENILCESERCAEILIQRFCPGRKECV
jgi:uncharacterized protein